MLICQRKELLSKIKLRICGIAHTKLEGSIKAQCGKLHGQIPNLDRLLHLAEMTSKFAYTRKKKIRRKSPQISKLNKA